MPASSGAVATVALAAALFVSACGSTVAIDTTRGPAEDPGLAGPTSTAAPTGPGYTDAAGPAGAATREPAHDRDAQPDRTARTEVDGVTDDPAVPDDSPTTGPTGDGRPVAPGTRGVDDQQIRIGLEYAEETAARDAIGIDGVTSGDMRRQWEALVAHHNENGGLAGREIVPVFHAYDASSSQSTELQQQAACATFTQDTPVYAAIINRPTSTYLACLDDAGVGAIGGGGRDDDAALASYPSYVVPQDLSLSEVGRVLPGALAGMDYFAPESAAGSVRVGVVTYDAPRFRRVVEEALAPTLQAEGHAIEEVAYLSELRRVHDAGAVSSQASNAVLRFSSRGIDHVLFIDYNGAAAVFFMQAAESQQYRPQYGLNSGAGGQALVGLVPEAQLQDSLLVGWSDIFDVGMAEARKAPNPQRRSCEAIFADAGITFEDFNAYGVAMAQCGSLDSLVRSVEASSGPLAHASLPRGAERLARSWNSPVVGATWLGTDRHFGVATYRPGGFIDDCTCFRYTGADRDL